MNDGSQTPNTGGQGPNPPPPPPGGYYYTPPPPMQPRRRKSYLWVIPVAIGVVVLGIIGLAVMFRGLMSMGDMSEYGSHVALIRVTGVITTGGGGGGLFGGTSAGSEDIIDQLERARKKSEVKAIVLRINSPGGSPAASEEVYNEINRVRKSGKIVYTSMADVAASGGYYIASASDRIYADSSTLTGSIGVIWDITDMSGLYKKIGFSPQVIKSGKFKDIGSSNRPLTPEERQLLQDIVMETYGQFVKAVADGRHMPVAEVKKIADGRVLTGTQAVRAKLVDRIGGLRETVRAAAKKGGIRDEPRVVEYRKRTAFSDLFGAESERLSGDAERAIGKQLIDQLVNGKGSPSGLR